MSTTPEQVLLNDKVEEIKKLELAIVQLKLELVVINDANSCESLKEIKTNFVKVMIQRAEAQLQKLHE